MGKHNLDFRWAVDIDYDKSYSCWESGCDMICRCGTIVNALVTSVSCGSVLTVLADNVLIKIDDKVLYFLDRLISIYQLWSPSVYEINICGGYYGDEIDSVILGFNTESKITQDLAWLNYTKDVTLTDIVKYLLNLEYGYIPEYLNKLEYKIWKVNGADLVNNRKLVKRTLDYQINTDIPIGVYTVEKSKFKVEDGNHRLTFVQPDKQYKIIVGE